MFDPLGPDRRAVTPAMGKALVVGLTVILAASGAAYFGGVADGVTTAPPTAAFDVEQYGNSLTVTHASGDAIDSSELSVRVGGTESPWIDVGAASDGTVSSGDAATIGVTGDTALQVVWRADGESAILVDESVSAPATATFSGTVSAVNESGVNGTYAGFGSKHLEARGQTPGGQFRAGKSAVQVRDAGDDPIPPANGGFDPASGDPYPFTLEYTGSEFTFSVDGNSVTTGAVTMDDGSVAIQLKIASSDVTRLSVSGVELDGAPVDSAGFSLTDAGERSVVIRESSMVDGFVLTGTVVYEYGSGVADGAPSEDMILRIDVA